MASRARPWLLLALALLSGVVAAYLALHYLRDRSTTVLKTSGNTQVVLAARDLPVGSIVTARDVHAVDWPGNVVPPGFITKEGDVVGRGLITPVRLNEPYLETKLAPKGAGGGLPMLINDGRRALTLRVDDVSGVAGFVIPGTRVDMLLTMTDHTPTNEPTTRIIMQNVEALASAQSIQTDAEGKPRPVPTLTLLVTPAQAETLTLASQQGNLRMALRNTLDTAEVLTPGARAGTLMKAEPLVAVRGKRVVRVKPSEISHQTIVEGFRGGERTISRFNTPAALQPDTR